MKTYTENLAIKNPANCYFFLRKKGVTKIAALEFVLIKNIKKDGFVAAMLKDGYFEIIYLEIENIEFVLFEESFNVKLSIDGEEHLLFEAPDEYSEKEYWATIEKKLKEFIVSFKKIEHRLT